MLPSRLRQRAKEWLAALAASAIMACIAFAFCGHLVLSIICAGVALVVSPFCKADDIPRRTTTGDDDER